ncbi:MAG: ABC transporter permease, partial [Pseudomonadota bacterium]
LLPGFLHAPGPFEGTTSFTYTAEAEDGSTDDGTVTVVVHPRDVPTDAPEVDPGDGFAKNDAAAIAQWRSGLIRVDSNDEVTKSDGAQVVAINGESIAPGQTVDVDGGSVTLSDKGTPNFEPSKGWQMEPLYLPAPEEVWSRSIEIVQDGFRNFTLLQHLGYSLFRVIVGFLLGALVGIPLGYAMGLSDWFRGWFDPIVEFMRPVPPLALIPLVIIWAGIGEAGKIILLFLAALWIMAIAARAGVSGVKISKVHAAYSLGASKWQIMRHVIVPNSLPEIFTGARVAMGVCWGTVVAAELVAAEQGAGMMIMTASKFQNTDIVIMGIILIGVIGFGIDMLMRWAERLLVPWKGKG